MSSSLHYRIDETGQWRFTMHYDDNGVDKPVVDDVPFHWLQLAAILADKIYEENLCPDTYPPTTTE